MDPALVAVVTADGSTSAAYRGGGSHGELFHQASGAWTQARVRYAAGAAVRRAGFAAGPGGSVRLLDVGTGLGWNLAAAAAALAGTGARLEAVSLEAARAPLEFAAGLSSAATGVPERCHRGVRDALRACLRELTPGARPGAPAVARAPLRVAGADVGRLTLCLGDARATLPTLPDDDAFDAVFLDPFSPRVEGELWEAPFLAEVARRMTAPARLVTYSAATAVRVALAASGLQVARAPRLGRKAEGTLAGWDLVPGEADADLVRRLARRLAERAGENPSASAKPGPRSPKILGLRPTSARRREAPLCS